MVHQEYNFNATLVLQHMTVKKCYTHRRSSKRSKRIGIETLPPDELLRMKQEWDIGNSNSK